VVCRITGLIHTGKLIRPVQTIQVLITNLIVPDTRAVVALRFCACAVNLVPTVGAVTYAVAFVHTLDACTVTADLVGGALLDAGAAVPGFITSVSTIRVAVAPLILVQTPTIAATKLILSARAVLLIGHIPAVYATVA
jgi:hypothetical protein